MHAKTNPERGGRATTKKNFYNLLRISGVAFNLILFFCQCVCFILGPKGVTRTIITFYVLIDCHVFFSFYHLKLLLFSYTYTYIRKMFIVKRKNSVF